MTTSSAVSHRARTTRRTPLEHHWAATEVLRNSGHPRPEDHRSRCLAPFSVTAKCPVQEAVDHQIEQVGVYLVAAGLEVIGDAHEVFNDDCHLVKGEPDWTLTW